jgi:hypothetical protein
MGLGGFGIGKKIISSIFAEILKSYKNGIT